MTTNIKEDSKDKKDQKAEAAKKEEPKKDDKKDKKEGESSEESEDDHDHSHDHGKHEDGKDEDGHKASKGEKRFKKVLLKNGATSLDSVKRVTMKTNKNFVMYIDKPSILKTGEKEATYIVFGEPKFLDFKNQMAGSQAAKFAEGKKPDEAAAHEPKAPEIKKVEEEDESKPETILDSDVFKNEDVEHVMKYTSSTRNKAIRALREKKGDIVEAITSLS